MRGHNIAILLFVFIKLKKIIINYYSFLNRFHDPRDAEAVKANRAAGGAASRGC